MLPRLTVSALLVAGLFAMTTAAQPPANPNKPLGDKVKPADPADGAVAAALANDPDVRIARAKVHLAEAEVAKAKQAVVLRVMTLNATIREHKAAVTAAQDNVARITEMVRAGTVQQSLLVDARGKFETAQAALARAETELKLLTGGGRKELVGEALAGQVQQEASTLEWFSRRVERDQTSTAALALAALYAKGAVQGPIRRPLRAALDKPVKLGAKGEKVTFEKALEVFKKEAGLDVPVREMPVPMPKIVSDGEELPIGAWFQLFQDIGGQENPFTFYVREYGLLVANKQTAPPDAPTLTEFWKRKLDAAAKPEEPKK